MSEAVTTTRCPVGARNASDADDTLFLPDFCDIRSVFAVVVVGELLAFVLALSPIGRGADRWTELALISLFVQWVGLTGAAVLCAGRRWLRRLDNAVAGVASFALILAITAAVSGAVTGLERSGLAALYVSSSGHADFLLRNLAISAIVSAVALRYLYVQHQWKSKIESEARARVQALQSRIRPHFLFNSMNTIASFTRTRPDLAEQVVEDLSDLFRVSLGDARVPMTLGRELEVCRQYLRIEALRLAGRLDTRWRVDGLPHDALLPALTLQPLVENAIYHGIEPAADGGVIRIEGERSDGGIAIRIANTVDEGDAARAGNRMAMENVRERLQAFFDGAGTLQAGAEGDEFVVRVAFPYRVERP